MVEKEKSCWNCWYFRICVHIKCCSHPDHPEPINNFEGVCDDWIIWDEKWLVDRKPRVEFEVQKRILEDK